MEAFPNYAVLAVCTVREEHLVDGDSSWWTAQLSRSLDADLRARTRFRGLFNYAVLAVCAVHEAHFVDGASS